MLAASRLATFAAFAAILSSSQLALAAPTAKERAEARSLVKEGKKALKESRWADALNALTKADQLDPSGATEVALAEAQIGAGKLVEASKTLGVVADADDATAPAKKAREAARKALADLKPRIPSIKVTVKGPASAKTLLDGNAVEQGAEVSQNPGDHSVSASADGFLDGSKDVHLAEGAHETVTLTLAPKVVEAPPPPLDGRLPGAIVTGVGAAGLLVGAIFGGLAMTRTNSAKADCVGNVCPIALAGEVSRAKTDGNISTGLFVAGGLVAATGIVLLIVRPGYKPPASDDASKSASVSPWFGPGGAGLAATGRF